MTIKVATKLVYLVCLFCLTVVPVVYWIVSGGRADLGGLAGFVAASAAPMGALTAAMAATSIGRSRRGGDGEP